MEPAGTPLPPGLLAGSERSQDKRQRPRRPTDKAAPPRDTGRRQSWGSRPGYSPGPPRCPPCPCWPSVTRPTVTGRPWGLHPALQRRSPAEGLKRRPVLAPFGGGSGNSLPSCQAPARGALRPGAQRRARVPGGQTLQDSLTQGPRGVGLLGGGGGVSVHGHRTAAAQDEGSHGGWCDGAVR